MTVAERERKEKAIYRGVAPSIIEGLAAGESSVDLSDRIKSEAEALPAAQEISLDQRLVFRWIQWTEEQLESSRRRAAVKLVVPLWIGVAAVVVALLGQLFRWFGDPVPPSLIAVVGIGTAAYALYRISGLRGRVRLQMIDELSSGEAEAAGDAP